jgi:hypothetical protein
MLGFIAISRVEAQAREYAVYTRLTAPDYLPAGDFAAFIASTRGGLIGVFTFLFLLFPAGESPRPAGESSRTPPSRSSFSPSLRALSTRQLCFVNSRRASRSARSAGSTTHCSWSRSP